MSPQREPDILTVDQAAALLGVSLKTFHKVLHSEAVPARKIGREWKFSRQALIDWVGSGSSIDFYRTEPADRDLVQPTPPPKVSRARRTAGWQIEMD